MNDQQQRELITMMTQSCDGDGFHDTPITGLQLIRTSHPTMRMPVVYNASFCLVVQGEKHTLIEEKLYRYGAGDYLVVSINLPVTGQVTQADPQRPYLSLKVDVDFTIIGELIAQGVIQSTSATADEFGVFVEQADDALVDVFVRLLKLLSEPESIAFLAPLYLREFHYRLLNTPKGAVFVQMAMPNNKLYLIAQAIQVLKDHLDQSFRVEDLAQMTGMSASSFHHLFKAVTAMSPLQYHKRLRLLEARRLMLTGELDAASAGFQVGYLSPSQFSREYRRYFGTPPRQSITELQPPG
jgi:AraC-like DNA-binding protein